MLTSVTSLWLLVLILLVSLVLVVKGADFLVDGASAIARRFGISEFVIGLTIVGFGTSCPELVVSVNGALAGNSAISLGNVLGSNIFNVMLVLGMTAIFTPVAISKQNVYRDIPITLGATVLLLLFGMSHTFFGIGATDELSRVEAVVMLIVFCVYLWSCFKFDNPEENAEESKEISVAKSWVFVLGGLVALIFGGQLFVESAVAIAHSIGVSDKVIAITILAGGTSFPELATCVVAAAKHKGGLALGNILGSCVFNILLILGVAGAIYPISFASMNWIDMGVLLSSQLLLLGAAFTGRRRVVDRWEGLLFIAVQVAYFIFLFINL